MLSTHLTFAMLLTFQVHARTDENGWLVPCLAVLGHNHLKKTMLEAASRYNDSKVCRH